MIPIFNGGLNTRVDAHLLNKNESRVLINVDTNTAVLAPIKDKTDLDTAISKYFYFNTIDDTWYSENIPTDWLEFNNVLYKSDRINTPTKIKAGVETNVGIINPTGAITATATSGPKGIERVDFVNSTSGGADLPVDTTYKYKIVNKDSTSGLTSFSYWENLSEGSSLRPYSLNNLILNNIGSAKAGTSYITHHTNKLTGTQNTTTITIDDTNASLVRVYRQFDGFWRALTADFQVATTPVVDDTYDISGNDALEEDDLLTGVIQYAMTYYNPTTGVESAPILSNEVEVSHGRVALTNLPVSTDAQVTIKRLYRIGGNLTSFSLVTTLTNVDTTYTDTIADTDIVGAILSSEDHAPAPEGLKYLKEAYAMLFGAVGNRLRFTPVGKPEVWPTTYYLEFPEAITGISKTVIGLLIHTYYKTYLVTGTGPTALAQQIMSNDQGCVSHDSIKETRDTALWVSTDGVCASDGSDVKVITKDKLGKINLTSVVCSVLHDQVYTALLSSGIAYAIDFEFGLFKQFAYGVDYLQVADDVIHGYLNGKLYSLNTATAALPLTYKSPDFALNGLSVEKIYTRIYAYATGEMTLTVYIDGKFVTSYTLAAGLNDRPIPEDKKRGSYISFEITGKSTVRELKWDSEVANG